MRLESGLGHGTGKPAWEDFVANASSEDLAGMLADLLVRERDLPERRERGRL